MEKEYLFDKPKNVKRFFMLFFVILGIFLVADFLTGKHGEFAWENWPGFYAAFGFVAFVILVFGAKYILRPLVKRREDYYE